MTPTQQLISDRLGQSLDTYVWDRLVAGKTWQSIADDINASDIGIKVSRQSLHQWYATAPTP